MTIIIDITEKKKKEAGENFCLNYYQEGNNIEF